MPRARCLQDKRLSDRTRQEVSSQEDSGVFGSGRNQRAEPDRSGPARMNRESYFFAFAGCHNCQSSRMGAAMKMDE